MSDKKIITIPSLTEGREPYEVAIPTMNAMYHHKMMMLQTAQELLTGKEACEGAEQAVEKANISRNDAQELVTSLVDIGADPAFIASKKDECVKSERAIDDLRRIYDKTKKLLDKDIAEVEKHFGNIPDLGIGDRELTYLLIGKDILGEPWAVMACCNLNPVDWVDIDYEDYADICKELLRRTPRFFRVRHRKTMT